MSGHESEDLIEGVRDGASQITSETASETPSTDTSADTSRGTRGNTSETPNDGLDGQADNATSESVCKDVRLLRPQRHRLSYLIGLAAGLVLGIIAAPIASTWILADHDSSPWLSSPWSESYQIAPRAMRPDHAEGPEDTGVEPIDDEPGVAGFLTRITVDHGNEVLRITREPYFAPDDELLETREVLWSSYKRAVKARESLICIPDLMQPEALEQIDHRWTIGGREVRISLRLWGPLDGAEAAASTVAECLVWVDGMPRLIGQLANSLPEVQRSTVFETISVFVKGRVLVATACRRHAGEWRASTTNGNLATTNTWILTSEDFFQESEENSAAETGRVPESHIDTGLQQHREEA